MWSVLLFLTVPLFAYYVVASRRYLHKYAAFYKVPTPPNYVPLLGNTLRLISSKNVLESLCRMMQWNNGEQRVVAYIPFCIYITAVPEDAKIILNQALDKSLIYGFLKMVLQNTLLMAPVTLWRRNRKITARGFRQNTLDSFVPIFNAKSQVLVDKMRNRDIEDLCKVLETYTMDIFFEATLGIESNMLHKNNFDLVQHVTNVQDALFRRIGRVMVYYDFMFKWTKEWSVADLGVRTMSDFMRNVIAQKRSAKSQEPDALDQPMPVLDILLKEQPKEKFTDEYMTNEMLLFASAATDTTAYTLAYIFLMLAMHPEVQYKVLQEVNSILGEHPDVCVQDLNQLKYTEMAINETMRILPTVPTVGRKTRQDLDLGPLVIPTNTEISVNIFAMHRNAAIYPDPLKYDPERFRPEEVAKRHPYSFLPFSGGPRNCIGFKYAKMILMLTVANVVRNFRIITSHNSIEELQFESSVVMSPTTPLDVRFIGRK